MIEPSTARFCPFPPACVLRVRGEDALVFLQGQFTQNLMTIDSASAAYGLWLNQKGKVLGDSFVLRDGREFWVISFGTPAATLVRRLEEYIIADDVELENCTDQWTGFAMIGAGMGAAMLTEKISLPAPGQWAKMESSIVFRGRHSREANWNWLCPVGEVEPEWTRSSSVQVGTLEELEHQRISERIPRVPQDVGPGDLPNEAALESDAISYSKGCYLGQEVMARLKTSGQVRRNLLRVRGEGPAPILPAPLFAGDKQVGEIRTAAADINGFIGLAMLSLIPLGQRKAVALSAGGPENVVLLDRI